ncbi:MAG: PAS domain S-box protein [Candidatus Methanofastidiosa archaeon]|nr:PAS domain S-box protein [Candidatus Methanofastidiosa archaeon]
MLQLFENKKVITRENTYVNGRTYFVYDYSFVDTHDNKFVLELGIDITERKRVEDQLKNTSIQLEEIIEFLPDATFIIDKNKKVITWNRAIEEMTGVPKEDILGKSHDYVAVPFYGERRPFIADLVFEDNLDIKSKYSLIKKKGNSLYAEAFTPALYDNKGAFIWAIASPLLDHEGNVIGVIEAVRDITERVKAEESLRESREKYKKLADSLPEIVFETDEKGNLLFVNKNTFNITGYTEEDLKKGVNAIEFVIPEEREKVREKIQKILRGEKTTAGEYTALRKNGSTFPMIIHSNVVMMDEKPIGIRGIIFDVTEKKKAEEQIKESERTLKTILAAAPAGIKLVINRQIVWCNNRILEITGYPFEELKDRDLRFLYDNDEDYNKVGKILYEKWTNESYREVETRWKQKNGNLIDCHIRSSPLDLNDYSKGMIEVVTNITGSKKAQRQLEENMEYFAHLIDNIRNPLAIISGYLQVDGENQEIRDRIKKQIERIEDVLRQLDEGWMDTDDTRKFLKKHLD